MYVHAHTYTDVHTVVHFSGQRRFSYGFEKVST